MTGKLRWLAGFILGRLILLSLHGVRIAVLLSTTVAAVAGAALGFIVHPLLWAVPVAVAAVLVPLMVRAWRRSTPAQTGEREPWDTPTQPLAVVVVERPQTSTSALRRWVETGAGSEEYWPEPEPADAISRPDGLPFGMNAYDNRTPPQPWFRGPTHALLPRQHANLGDHN